MFSKSSSKKIVFFAGITVLIVAAVLTALVFTSNAFKSPKQIYLNAEGKNIKEIIDNIKDDGTFIGNFKKLSEHSHETEREYSLSINLGNSDSSSMSEGANLFSGGIPDLSSITKVLDSSKLVINQKSNPEKNQKITNVDVLINNTKLIDFMAAFENDVLSLSIPVVFDKYIVADLSKSENAVKNLDLPAWSEKFLTSANVLTPTGILKSLSFDEKKLDSIKKSYSKALKESINKEQISIEKKVPFKVGEFDLKCDKLTVKFEKEDIQRVIMNLIDATSESDAAYELIKENIKNIYELIKNTQYSGDLGQFEDIEAEFTKEKFINSLNKIKSDLEKAFNDLELPEGINMVIYTNKKEIVGRTIDTKIKTAGFDEAVGLSFNYAGVSEYKNKNIKDLEIKLNYDINSSVSEITIEYSLDGDIKKETESGKKNFSIAVGSKGFSTKVFKLDADYTIVSNPKSNSKESTHDYNVSIGVPMMFSIEAGGSLTVHKWEKSKEKQFGNDIDFSINLNVPASMFIQETSLGVNFSGKTKNTLDVNFDFPSFDSGNSIDITNASEEEISQLKTEIEESVMKFLSDNKELINLFQ